jgi:hypothetical protein
MVGTAYAYILLLMGNTGSREPSGEPERQSAIEQAYFYIVKEICYEIGNLVSSCYA